MRYPSLYLLNPDLGSGPEMYGLRSLDPVEEASDEEENDGSVVDTGANREKGKSRVMRMFKKLRPRKSLQRPAAASNPVTLGDAREDDSTIAVDNTSGGRLFFLHEERRDASDDDDSSRFLDDFSVTAFAPDDEQQPLVLLEESEDIWSACKVGDEAFVRGALLYSPETVHRLHDGRTPLYFASLCGHEEIVKMLLEAGATDPERTAYLCALNQNIRTLIKKHTSHTRARCNSGIASYEERPRDDIPNELTRDEIPEEPVVANAPRFTMPDSDKSNDFNIISQMSSLSNISSKSEAKSKSSQSGSSVSTPVKQPEAKSVRRKFSPRELLKASLISPRNFVLPDLDTDGKKAREVVADSALPDKPRGQGDGEKEPAKDSGESFVDILLNTSLVDCREVVLPDILVDAAEQEEGVGEVTASNKETHKLSLEDKQELLMCNETADGKAIAPLKATACGITAVLEEEEAGPREKDKCDSESISVAVKVIEFENSWSNDEISAHTDKQSVDSDVYVHLIKRENSMKEGVFEKIQASICNGCEMLADYFLK